MNAESGRPPPALGSNEAVELAALRLALDAARMGWFEHDFQRDRMTFSEALTAIFGFDAESFGGTLEGFFSKLHPDDRDSCIGKIAEARYSGGRFSWEARVVQPDGAVRWIYLAGQGSLEENGEASRIVGVAHDVTDRKRMEEALRNADRQKDDFLAMLGHELRNPMTPIRSAVEYLRRTGSASDPDTKHLDIISRQVEQMVRLVDDLLDVSRITRGKIILSKKPISLSDVAAMALESARPAIESRGHTINLRIADPPPWVDGDLTRLSQVLLNLLDNAAKYTDAGGTIDLTIGEDGDDALIKVRDNGAGISEEMLPNVFDLFTQADATLDRARGGLGLGLTLVRRLTEKHGGAVSVSSGGLGRGSEFVVRIPKSSVGAVELDAKKSANASASRRLLIIDDNIDAAESLAKLMHLSGHQVRTAYDGSAGLEAMAGFNPELILLDIGLPGINGYDVAREARQRFGSKPFLLALTGYGSGDVRKKCQEAGFDAHLVKPAELDALDEIIANYNPDRAG